jgi:hypothetical protein
MTGVGLVLLLLLLLLHLMLMQKLIVVAASLVLITEKSRINSLFFQLFIFLYAPAHGLPSFVVQD